MNARSVQYKTAALSLAATLTLALGAQGAFAATMNNAVNGLPPAQHAGGIAFISGGIGSDQSAAFKAATAHYPLSLEFARQSASGNEYLADVPVTIADAHGDTLLSTRTHGPFMLVALPHGEYVVSASHDGKTVKRTVEVGKTTHEHEAFVWPA
ncbi:MULTISPECIES: carboxypeptidase regulatory-like domain-containing protein [unclassified Paraburkholderia]|uniref:carboxypeptidase regulatory-like domain-containing protein n=1 Tax=unclassified Paraburkholderia TaxID=2615204 RepID=UPI00197D2592|nr:MULTISPECIES: carboxypeptidase regulatory-like domain-containing protein [unclassified Paraburkholderia]MBN3856464.1 carboxypeptidase regulatory-like domain-containing protein [Paraburkholderia sp. Ac-20340]